MGFNGEWTNVQIGSHYTYCFTCDYALQYLFFSFVSARFFFSSHNEGWAIIAFIILLKVISPFSVSAIQGFSSFEEVDGYLLAHGEAVGSNNFRHGSKYKSKLSISIKKQKGQKELLLFVLL
jgi:hypothetical protein